MKEFLNILVVDDHPMTIDAYINLINDIDSNSKFSFTKATNCKTAYSSIEVYKKTKESLDVALIDINIPPFEQEKILSGTDIAKIVRLKFPLCKIIMLTMHQEHLILNKVFKTINPEGFISKNDIDFTTFPEIFLKIIKGQNYFSPTINNSLATLFKNTVKWDQYDTQIIILIEKGIKTKDLTTYIDLSLSSIEKRKANIKRQIADKKVTDDELIIICKTLKLI